MLLNDKKQFSQSGGIYIYSEQTANPPVQDIGYDKMPPNRSRVKTSLEWHKTHNTIKQMQARFLPFHMLPQPVLSGTGKYPSMSTIAVSYKKRLNYFHKPQFFICMDNKPSMKKPFAFFYKA